MDRFSEIEAKFEAPHVYASDIISLCNDARTDPFLKPYSYKEVGLLFVEGYDTYYQQGNCTLRHRCDGQGNNQANCLTTKSRKSQENILDRHEVDLFLRSDVKAVDISVFLERTGWKPLFTINKKNTILRFRSSDTADNHVCVALYDTWKDNPRQQKRFLEVEIERESNCTDAEGRAVLDGWIELLQRRFNLKNPINQSLFEIYKE